MKDRLLLLLISSSLVCCQSPHAQTENQEVASSLIAADSLHTEAYNPLLPNPATGEINEYLDSHSIRINSRFPLITTIQNIEGLLGKPDSVVKVNFEEICPSDFRSEDSRIAYYRGIHFEQFGDSLDFQFVDFRKKPKIFLQSGSLRLDHRTTLEEVKKHFPNAVRNARRMDDDLEPVDVVSLPYSKELSDGHWMLIFQDSKLVRLDDWFPC